MPREQSPEFTSVSGETRKLAYENAFRETVREHPGILKAAIDLANEGVDGYNPGNISLPNTELEYNPESRQWLAQARGQNPFGEPYSNRPMSFGRGVFLSPGESIRDEEYKLELTVLGRSNREMTGTHSVRRDECDYFRLKAYGDSFFVKRSFVTTNPGFAEFHNTKKAKELLADLDFVHVVDAQLGYQSKTESWYISKWEDLESAGFAPYGMLSGGGFDDYGRALPEGKFLGFPNEEEFLEVERKFRTIKSALEPEGIHRDLGANLFYNIQTKTFVFLDVTSDNKEMLGDPITLL